MGGKIVLPWDEAKAHDNQQPAAVDRLAGSRCLHRATRLDTDARRVYCRQCHQEVDAFQILQGLAHDWDRVTRWRQEAERLRAQAGDRLAETLRLEENARARVRRLDPDARLPERPHGRMPM